MLASIVSLTLFLREVYLAIETFEIGLPAEAREDATDRLHAAHAKVERSVSTRGIGE